MSVHQQQQQQSTSSSYFVTKHSWKGKYKRVLVIESTQLSTYDPKTLKITNSWPYDEVIDVGPLNGDIFKLVLRKKSGNSDVLKFSSDFRKDILCDIIKFRPRTSASDKYAPIQYECSKFHWSRQELPTVLKITSNAVVQTDSLGNVHTHYYFKKIECLGTGSNPPGCVCITTSEFGRLHLFRIMSKVNSSIRDPEKLLDDFIKNTVEYSAHNTGHQIVVKREPITIDNYYQQRFGLKYSADEALTSLHEFNVYKLHHRHQLRPIRRILCLTNSCLVERNPDTYQPVTVKPLRDIFALIRSPDDPQVFSIEFASIGVTSCYSTTERDALLASLVEGVRASNNIDVHVKMMPTNLGLRCGPLYVPVEDEIERSHLRAFQTLPIGWSFMDAVHRFNTVCSYSGLTSSMPEDHSLWSESRSRLIEAALMSFVDNSDGGSIPICDSYNTGQQNIKPADVEQYYQAIRRLVASRRGFALFNQNERLRAYLGRSIVKTIKLNNDAITHAGFDVLCALMQPMHADCDIRNEQLNKTSLLATKQFLESLMNVLKMHINRGTGALVVSSMLDFLTYALCAPYSETTDSACFDSLLNLVAANGRDMYRLFQHPSLAIVKGAGLVIKAIIQEGEPNVSKRMQELSLAEGALMKHLHIGLFSQFKDGRTLGVQYLSRHLVALWSIDNDETKALFKRMFPLGLLNYLDSTKMPDQSMISLPTRDNLTLADQTRAPQNIVADKLNAIKDIHPSVRILERQLEQTILHWRQQIGLPKRDDRNVTRQIVLRKCRQRVKILDNWDMFYYQFYQDHWKPDLIWNLKTREELKNVIENELRQFMTDRELAAKHTLISWNYYEFEVTYKSLSDEIKIGDYFLRLLLEDSDNLMSKIQIKSPFHFLSDLYHRFLLNKRVDMRCTCLQAMAIIYGNYMEEIGHFNDIRYILEMLKDSRNRLERDRLILLLERFIAHKANAKDFIDANGTLILVDMITLAHLHTQRAFIPTQTNVIEATTEMLAAAASQEWFYSEDEQSDQERPDHAQQPVEEGDATKKRKHHGPLRFSEVEDLWKAGKVNERTKFWSQGMDGWRVAQDIPQLKWCLMAVGSAVMNESELAVCILNIFIQVCDYYPSHDLDGAIIRPFPRIKKYLSGASCLPHIVQLLVTFDPVIVERVSTLLLSIIEENPMISQLYRSGLFFFILMYSGSNLIPIGRLLHATHLSQAYRIDEGSNNKLKSFLTYLLPEAMVCYLENHGPDKFAQIFLGEFDTPETIWNGEMRRTMIEKIACHVADFTCRLKSNNRATYDYCPIAPISYDQLEDELFVDIYYLRNLCNTAKFPRWPVKDPVNLLKALLDAWKEEASRQPSLFSLDDALRVLQLDPTKYQNIEDIDEQTIKKSYRELALKYHPDKNPEGAHIFQEVHKAYEFLSSKQARERASGSNPKNLILIFKAQSILFSQCNDELHPYKYSGYPMLLETIKNEVDDERLFSKPDPLLAYACETTFYTLRCSSKNAEELRRENGLEILQQALSRCASVLSASSNPEDVCVQMCVNIVNCFTVASEFEACQQKLSELQSVFKDLNRILSYTKLHTLLLAATECAAAFAKCEPLHQPLFDSCIVFSLILLLFKYDYTLDEGGVEKNEGHNKQEMTNQTAKTALLACVRLHETGPDLFKRPLEALLTHYVASHFVEADVDAHEILKMLNSNIEIPYLIWNNGTRAELIDYLETQQRGIIQSGEIPDESYGVDFELSSYKTELRVGNIFIKVYNTQPSYTLRKPAEFVQALLSYIGSQAQYIYSSLSLNEDTSLEAKNFKNVEDCLQALSLVTKFNPGVETKCIGHFKLLFSLLNIPQLQRVQDMALNVISSITGNAQCVVDIADSDVLVYLWMVLYSSRSRSKDNAADQNQTSFLNLNNNVEDQPISRCAFILDTLLPLIANAKIVKDTLAKGCLVYLVDLFCNSFEANVRLKSADLMARITADKLSGFQAALVLNRFLPMIIVDAMKNSTKDAINLYDNNQENPELIWNSEIRNHINKSTSELANDIYDKQKEDPSYSWQMKPDFNLLATAGQDELVIAGVYVRLFNQNPTWVLRKPRDFLTELMNTFQSLIKSPPIDEAKLETVATALKNLLSAQPALLELIPAMGHVQSIVMAIYSHSNKSELVSKFCLTILSELGGSRACVDNMSLSGALLTEIKAAMSHYADTVDIACFGLRRIYEFSPVNDHIVQQAIEANFITYLLDVLSSNQFAQTRALIVKVLKSMTRNQTYGQTVETILGKSKTWSEYSDQKHDLFISNEPSIAAIAAPTANIAGYLQYNKQAPAQPPPVNDRS